MTGVVTSIVLAWVSLGPAQTGPSSEPTEPAVPLQRSYEGARAVVGPSEVGLDVKATDDGEPEETLGPEPEPAGPRAIEPRGNADVLVDASTEPHPPGKPVQPVPRILTTMQGWYPGEQAEHRFAQGQIVFVPGLQVRSHVGGISGFRLDDEGNDYPAHPYASGRVRWRPVVAFGRSAEVVLTGMVDFANGHWWSTSSSDPVVQDIIDDGQPPVPVPFDPVDFRELYITWTTRYGQLRAGQMSFNWGLGLLANDGNNMGRFGDMKFGKDGPGSIQERIMFGTKPLARTGGPGKDIIFAIGADLVYRDPNADLREGDLAGQGFLVVRWEPEARPGNWLGAYTVYRRQHVADDRDRYPDDDLLEVGVLDFAGQGFWPIPRDLTILGAFETVMIAGRTTYLRGDLDEHLVLQGAAALRGYLGKPEKWLVGFDGGWASGDANPDDDEVNNFEAAPGYTAGLLLFQWIQGWQSARSARQALDPELAGEPPNGVQYISTEGSVTNTVYIQPKARYAVAERFELWGGPLFATSAVPLVDPYATRLAGGAATNALGGEVTRHYLGTELDLGIRARYGFENLWLQGGLQGGVLFPGPAYRGPMGGLDGPIWGGFFRGEVRY